MNIELLCNARGQGERQAYQGFLAKGKPELILLRTNAVSVRIVLHLCPQVELAVWSLQPFLDDPFQQSHNDFPNQ